MTRIFAVALAVSASLTSSVFSQNPLSVSEPMDDNSVEAQLNSFQVDDRLEVNLFADETMGIANPVCFEWDAQDRLWVLCTWAYPQLKPGEKPDDKLLVLEDTDRDGKADKVSTFIDGLNMPTGFALGHGGVYIGEGHDLIHVKDTDDDGKADTRELLFTGFGTGDTHQNINSFAWTPGGELLFCQGLHCFSHVQTPWGNISLEEHGSWRLRPLRRQLNSYRRTSGGGNPWGYAFGKWGEPFIKSNNPGISELLPAMIQTDHIGGGIWGGAMMIGGSKIKSMIIEIVDSPHLPDDLQGDFLIAGYFARNIARLRPSVNGAGHQLQTLEPILTSTHNAYRPVDLSIGPDGALYVADWFNPIIGHYQASLRHPDRDESHGRIWRITAKDRPLLDPPPLATMNADELCEQLANPLDRTRRLAKQRLMDLPKDEAIAAVQKWIDSLKPDDPELEHKWFEAIGVFESHESPNRKLLDRLLQAKEYRARAYATRVAGRWHDRIANPLDILRASAVDEHPRVRLEAIVAVSEVRQPESITIAALAAGDSADPFLNFALMQSAHSLADLWKPALAAGELSFEKPAHLINVVTTLGDPEVIGTIREKLNDSGLPREEKTAMMALLARMGNQNDLQRALEFGAAEPEVLRAITTAAMEKNLKPPGGAFELLAPVFSSENEMARTEAIRLAAAWKMKEAAPEIREIATDVESPETPRLAAVAGLSAFGGPETNQILIRLSDPSETVEIRKTALSALANRNLPKATSLTAGLIPVIDETEISGLVSAVLSRDEGAKRLAAELEKSDAISGDHAKLIRRWMNSVGRSDKELIAALDTITGVVAPIPTYSQELVAEIAKNAIEKGDAKNGKAVFQMPLITCTSCHEVDGIKGAANAMKGPNLSAVAAGLPVELLIESVLWPDRQIKEGYAATNIVTKDGQVVSGFAHSRDRNSAGVRDLISGEIQKVPVSRIKTETNGGTMMPPGLTSSLTGQEFLDLIKFLTTLKTGGAAK